MTIYVLNFLILRAEKRRPLKHLIFVYNSLFYNHFSLQVWEFFLPYTVFPNVISDPNSELKCGIMSCLRLNECRAALLSETSLLLNHSF